RRLDQPADARGRPQHRILRVHVQMHEGFRRRFGHGGGVGSGFSDGIGGGHRSSQENRGNSVILGFTPGSRRRSTGGCTACQPSCREVGAQAEQEGQRVWDSSEVVPVWGTSSEGGGSLWPYLKLVPAMGPNMRLVPSREPEMMLVVSTSGQLKTPGGSASLRSNARRPQRDQRPPPVRSTESTCHPLRKATGAHEPPT